MLPEAVSEDLLYVTNYSTVMVFTYPAGKHVGTLKGFYSNVGECVDANGDVFVTNFKPVAVYEYAHGGTKRIATFSTRKAGTVGCAIDSTTGDLAISGETNAVEVFAHAKGKPTVIRGPAMFFGEFCTYDDKGNLFFLGLKSPGGPPHLSELPKGSRKFVTITLDASVDPESGIQWENGELTTVAHVQHVRTHEKAEIFHFALKGTEATKVGATPMNAAYTVLQYFILNRKLIAPNLSKSDKKQSAVLFYKYAAGGAPTMQIQMQS